MRTYFVSYAVNGFLGNFIFDVRYKVRSANDILELQKIIERENGFKENSVVVINLKCIRWRIGKK